MLNNVLIFQWINAILVVGHLPRLDRALVSFYDSDFETSFYCFCLIWDFLSWIVSWFIPRSFIYYYWDWIDFTWCHFRWIELLSSRNRLRVTKPTNPIHSIASSGRGIKQSIPILFPLVSSNDVHVRWWNISLYRRFIWGLTTIRRFIRSKVNEASTGATGMGLYPV